MSEPIVIDLRDCDPGFKYEVARRLGGAGLLRCYACGSCTACCAVKGQAGEVAQGYDPRRIIRLIVLGAKERVLNSPELWFCSTCFSCQEVCPMDVRFAEVLCAVKNIAAEMGLLPPGLSAQAGLLSERGRLYEVGEFENEKRAEVGLPAVSETPLAELMEG